MVPVKGVGWDSSRRIVPTADCGGRCCQSQSCFRVLRPEMSPFRLASPSQASPGRARPGQARPESTCGLADPVHLVELMSTLGYDRFDVASHDRGARVGYRMALDYPDRVKRLASLDTVPTLDIWEAADKDFAIDAFHWPLLAQPAPFPERLIGADPDGFLDQLLTTWAGSANALDPATRCRHPSRSGSAGQTTCALYRLIAGISSPKNCLRRVHTGCWTSSIPRALETDSCVHANAPAFGLPTLVQDRTGA